MILRYSGNLGGILEEIKQHVNAVTASLCLNYLPTSSNSNSYNSDSPAAYKLFRNLRELLWYWMEYYGKRGRDRLSLEFGTRIPCAEWMEVVHLLCADNFSEHTYSSASTANATMAEYENHNSNNAHTNTSTSKTALLPHTITLPLSPYFIHPHPVCFQEWSKVNPMKLNYTHHCLVRKTNTNLADLEDERYQKFI